MRQCVAKALVPTDVTLAVHAPAGAVTVLADLRQVQQVQVNCGEFLSREGLSSRPNVAFIPKPYRLPEFLEAITQPITQPPHRS